MTGASRTPVWTITAEPGSGFPSPRVAIPVLAGLIAVLAAVAALAGLLVSGGDGAFTFESVRGDLVEVYGRGIYEYDSVFQAAGNRGTDLITLVLAIPLLVVTTVLAVRGSLRARLLQLGAFVYFLYVYASLSLGAAAYNDLFFLYVALFGASLFAVIFAFVSFDLDRLSSGFSKQMPRRFPGWFMIASAGVTLLVWLMPAELDGRTTLVTHALDLAIIVPSVALGGVLVLQGRALGYLAAFSLLVLEVLLAPLIVAQTAFQLAADVEFTAAEIAGPVAGFTTLAAVAAVVLVGLLRHVSEESRLA